MAELAAACEEGVHASCETLQEFLARSAWDDGTARSPGTLLVCCQDGHWKAWVNDKDGDRTCWVSGVTLAELLELVSQGLDTDTLPWRAAKRPAGAQGKRA